MLKNLTIKLFCFLLPWLPILNASSQPKLILIAPVGGITIANNIPTFSWIPVSCNYYEVWINDKMMDTVNARLNSYVPFPLSFGEHKWEVVAVKEGIRIKSECGFFIVDDKPLGDLPLNALLLRHGWKMQSSVLVDKTGAELSGSSFTAEGWHTTTLPVTVLSALVRNGIYPNPYVNTNNMLIPDSNDDYNQEYDLLKYSHIPGKNPWNDAYWFHNSFEVPSSYNGKLVWLNFNEINYRAEVWLNGQIIVGKQTMVGMERIFKFNVTSLVKQGEKNFLAIAIYPLDIPGKPANEPLKPLSDPGMNMGDGMISKNYAKWDVVGWDWQPAVRDRDMGITEDVFLSATDEIELSDIYVTTFIPLPDTSYADITISADLINHSHLSKKGIITGVVKGTKDSVLFEMPFSLAPLETKSVLFNVRNIKQLRIKNPELWWPFGYGDANLYSVTLTAQIRKMNKAIIKTNFGIRRVETYIGANERVYKINGKEIYTKGGNWVMDMMLNWNSKRYEDEILLSKNANLNLLRIWGPTGVAPKAFYNAADKHGVLLWQDFLNDFWGTFRNSPGFTPDDDLYRKITIGIVKKYRNHPSLIIWCGGNEGPNPRESLIMGEILPKYDGLDSRHYLKQSDGDGLHGGGPYHTIRPGEYFTHPRLHGFSSEIGPSGIPVFESVLKFMPNPGENCLEERFPLDGVWAYHDANDWPGTDSRKFSSYDNIVRDDYGATSLKGIGGVEQYLKTTQLVNYDVYRASIESINRQLWKKSSGILLWKSNSSWPSMVWQIYDWYMQAHAGYYGTKTASSPLHIQLNRDSMDVVVLNALHREFKDVHIKAQLFGPNLQELWKEEKIINLAENRIQKTGWVVPSFEKLTFLQLKLESADGTKLSENFYWLSNVNDFSGLSNLTDAKLTAEVKKQDLNGKTRFTVLVKNSGNSLAFMVALRVQGEQSGMELLPSLWSNNYVSLLPDEKVQLYVEIDHRDLTETPIISIQAWNMPEAIIIK